MKEFVGYCSWSNQKHETPFTYTIDDEDRDIEIIETRPSWDGTGSCQCKVRLLPMNLLRWVPIDILSADCIKRSYERSMDDQRKLEETIARVVDFMRPLSREDKLFEPALEVLTSLEAYRFSIYTGIGRKKLRLKDVIVSLAMFPLHVDEARSIVEDSILHFNRVYETYDEENVVLCPKK